MSIRAKMALLLCLAATAIFTAAEAVRSLQPDRSALLPGEIYARFAVRSEAAEYFLRDRDGFVAVYRRARDRKPLRITAIELSGLRKADRAMVEEGIPVANRRELLQLLEDLGS